MECNGILKLISYEMFFNTDPQNFYATRLSKYLREKLFSVKFMEVYERSLVSNHDWFCAS